MLDRTKVGVSKERVVVCFPSRRVCESDKVRIPNLIEKENGHSRRAM